jgi:hypothetical protein
MRHEPTPQKFRGLSRRRERIEKHNTRADKERRIFEGKLKKRIKVWVDNELSNPTNYLVVEFRLAKPITAKELEEILYEHLGVLL